MTPATRVFLHVPLPRGLEGVEVAAGEDDIVLSAPDRNVLRFLLSALGAELLREAREL